MFYFLTSNIENFDEGVIEFVKSINLNFLNDRIDKDLAASEVHSRIAELEQKLTEVIEKLVDQRYSTRTIRTLVSSFPKITDSWCDKWCSNNRKLLILDYQKSRDWLETYKGEKDRLMSELSKFHSK